MWVDGECSTDDSESCGVGSEWNASVSYNLATPLSSKFLEKDEQSGSKYTFTPINAEQTKVTVAFRDRETICTNFLTRLDWYSSNITDLSTEEALNAIICSQEDYNRTSSEIRRKLAWLGDAARIEEFVTRIEKKNSEEA
ncbi:MAG: hypothetical protein EOP06_27195 [Proteobacteria bacterium]|nr:MAG: hypothetical protein EOP06_27195 [Pseudomonadota bacterium]